MYSLCPPASAYLIFVQLACLAIELEVTERQKTHRTFHVTRRHHVTAIVYTRRERNVDESLLEPGHYSPSDVAISTHEDAFENRLDLSPDHRTFFRDARLVDITLSRGRNTAVNKLDPGDVVGERRNAKRLDRSLSHHASRARTCRCDCRVSNQLVSTILPGRKRSHVLVKDRVELHVFVTHVA